VATTEAVSGRGFGATSRRDRWWVEPALTGLGLTAFGVYSIVVAASNTDFQYTGGGARYLSPFYSPDLRNFGLHVSFTYAFFVIWVPLGFRLTCYYYRKAYYRAFFLAPPACAVAGLSRRRYRGETKFPFVLQNLHRYFLYLSTIVLGFLWYDAVRAFFFDTSGGSLEFGVGLGSLVMLGNVVLLTGFTFGCNSLRHLIGGQLDCFSCTASARTRHRLWRGATRFNHHHMALAWISLGGVALTDLYIRLAAAGVFHDPRII
jgi:hypothetical protein